ncbi:MAG: tetratricopeptide repeat protein [Cyanobacteria bacterium P01_B01_bin.77]
MTSFFVSYNKADKAWAEWIAWILEKAGHRVVIQAWDFRPGGNFVLDMQRATAETDKTLVVLSDAYLNAEFTQPEWAAAFANDPRSLQRKIIPIRVQECQPNGLLRPIVYVDLVNLESNAARQAILNALPERLKPNSEPAFPKSRQAEKRNEKPEFPNAPTPWNVPYERNPFFTGREAILQTLHQQLNQDCAVALSQIQAISGLGGIGKTQTAVEYVYRYREDYDAVFWVQADTTLELSSGFVAIAQMLNLPQKDTSDYDKVVQAVKQWLRRNLNWLLIFDNADQPELVHPFLPKNAQDGHILITSRAQDFQDFGIARPIEMEILEPEDARVFLLRRSNREELISQPSPKKRAEVQAATQLAAELGYLPLALEQAAAYILTKKARFQDYLASYQKRRLRRLETAKPKLGNYSDSVATVWTLNFQQVEETAPASADLLRISTLLHPDNIPFELLIQGRNQLGDALANILMNAEEDPLVVNEILEPLCAYSLIRVDEMEQTFSIHRLLQEVTRAEMETAHSFQIWINRAILAINQLLPIRKKEGLEYQDEYKNWPILERIANHGKALFQIYQASAYQSSEAAQIFDCLGVFLRDKGEYFSAESLLKEAMKIRKQLLGDAHPDVAWSLNSLAMLYDYQSRYTEAELLLKEALSIRKRLLGEMHSDVAQNLHDLAWIYKNQGRYSEAELLYQKSLPMFKKLLGIEHPMVAESLNDLGGLYINQGRYGEAEQILKESLAMYKQLFGETHPAVARNLSNLAVVYVNQDRYGEAEPILKEALVMEKQLLGDEHPDVAFILNSLARLYDNQGRYSDAKPFYQDALVLLERIFGPDHSSPNVVRRNLQGLQEQLNQ